MPIFKNLTILLLFLNPFPLQASCSGPFYSITELLNHDPDNHHIFTCKIIGTYISNTGFESIAVVQKRFIGSPKDTIYIRSGGMSTAGGQKLFPGSEWLIFSRTTDNLHYGATVCDYLSSQISSEQKINYSSGDAEIAKIYLDVLDQYVRLKKSQFSGYKEIRGSGRLIAKGSFTNGIADGEWVHYSRYDDFKIVLKRSEIAYRNGKLHGKYNLYLEDRNNNIIGNKRIFNEGLLISEESFSEVRIEYKYLNENEREISFIKRDSFGAIIRQRTIIELDYNNTPYRSLTYKHGYYLNKIARDSSKYLPLAKGQYFKGARVGDWIFYNKKGEVVNTLHFPDSAYQSSGFYIYEEDGNVRMSGNYEEGKRTGVWKYFYNNKLQTTWNYNRNGELLLRVKYFSSGRREITPFANHKKHGKEIVFNEDEHIRSIEEYKNGIRNGISIIFNHDGSIKEESNFINHRKFSVEPSDSSSYYNNGFLNGYHIQKSYKTGKTITEGNYWNGYKTGVWLEHGENDTYKKLYYQTDEKELMNQSGYIMPFRTELFDKDGNLKWSR